MRASITACVLRLLCLKRMTLIRFLLCLLCLSIVSSLIFTYYLMSYSSKKKTRQAQPLKPEVNCPIDPDVPSGFVYKIQDHRTKERHHLGRRALIIVETQYTKSGTR